MDIIFIIIYVMIFVHQELGLIHLLILMRGDIVRAATKLVNNVMGH